jgi:RNA polymerase sigma-70 factor (ECF subfamily)
MRKKGARTFLSPFVYNKDAQRMETDLKPFQADDFPEREILQRALRGEAEAFEEVIALYGRRLYALAYGILGNAAEAEDVVQETFLKGYARRWLIRKPEKFPAWLSITARNRACDLLRKHRANDYIEEIAEMADDDVPRPSANLDESERNGAVRRLLHTLPENHRVAVTLFFMDGMGYREIEETMGLSNGALRGILARAMKTLRKRIGTSLLPDITGVN